MKPFREKRILKLPKHFSNTAAVTALDWPSMRARLLVRKLSFLKRVADAQADTLVGGVVRAFSDGLDTLCLARECRDLEEEMGVTTNPTTALATSVYAKMLIALLCCIFTCLWLVKIRPHTRAISSHIAFSPIK